VTISVSKRTLLLRGS